MNQHITPFHPGQWVASRPGVESARLVTSPCKVRKIMFDEDLKWYVQLDGLISHHDDWYPADDFELTIPPDVRPPQLPEPPTKPAA